LRYRTKFLENLPIQGAQQQRLEKLVNERLTIGKRLFAIGDKLTDKKIILEKEAKETDSEIDELVYKIYGITDAEKEIVENSLK
jgi:hypothetical protein